MAKSKSKLRSGKPGGRKGGKSAIPEIRTHKDLVNHIADLAAEFTGDHRGAEAVIGGSTLVDSFVKYRIPTGCPNFDSMLDGGFPGGRVTQVFGKESTAKTTILWSSMIQCAKMGGVSILMDPEVAFDGDRYRRMGGDPDTVVLLQHEYGGMKRGEVTKKSKNAKDRGLPSMTVQDVFDYMYDILDSIASKPQWKDRPVIVGLDSLDNITTDESLNGDPAGMTLKPRLIREGFRQVTAPIAKSKAAFVIISQTIENIGGYGAQQTTAGGGGPRFIASVRIHMKKAWLGDADFYTKNSDKSMTGNALIDAQVVKNKLNRPYMNCITAINNDSSQALEGIDPDFSLLYGLFADTVVTRPGTAYRYLKILRDDPEVAAVADRFGLTEVEYPFLPSKWRKYLADYPGVREYMLALSRSKFRRPGVFAPVPEEFVDDKPDNQEHEDRA